MTERAKEPAGPSETSDRTQGKRAPEPAAEAPAADGLGAGDQSHDGRVAPSSVIRIQRSAGNRAASVYVQMQRTATRSNYDLLVEASRGSWIGNVDEERCLQLLYRLTPDEQRRTVADPATLRRLAMAFNASEMARMCSILPLPLHMKLVWCDIAGELNAVDIAIIRGWISLAPPDQVETFLRNTGSFDRILRRLPGPPAALLRASFPGPAICRLYATYVSMAKWLARAGALTVVTQIAQPAATPAQITAAKQRLVDAALWDTIKRALPRGAGLPQNAKDALFRIATFDAAETKALFEIRFKPLTGNWDVRDIRAVWAQLNTLPDQDVSQNTILAAFHAITGDQAFWSSPRIELGAGLRTSTIRPDRLPHTVRHEVGHAVHELMASTVNAWLRQGVQFWYYPDGAASHQQIIADFGGFPASYIDMNNNPATFTPADQSRILSLLTAHGNTNKWVAKTTLPAVNTVVRSGGTPTQAQKDVLLWEAMPAGLRTCYDESKSYWYAHYRSFPRGAKGYTFYNHYYNKGFYFSPSALAAINATGDDYSAMSEKEFFANCYAEFFENPGGAQNPALWGGSLNDDVKAFFRTHILRRQPYQYQAGAGAGASIPAPAHSVPRPA